MKWLKRLLNLTDKKKDNMSTKEEILSKIKISAIKMIDKQREMMKLEFKFGELMLEYTALGDELLKECADLNEATALIKDILEEAEEEASSLPPESLL